MGQSCSARREYRARSEGEAGAPEDAAGAELPDRPALHDGPVFGVAAAGPHEVLTCGDDRAVRLWAWDGQAQALAPAAAAEWTGHEGSVNRVCYSAAGDAVFSCSRDLTVKRWARESPRTPVATFAGHTLNVSAICVSEAGDWLFSGARDTSVRVWDVETAATTFQAKTSRNIVTCACLVPAAGDRVVAQGSEDLSVRLWDVRVPALQETGRLTGYVYFPLAIAAARDGQRLLTSSKGFNSTGCEARLWDLRAPDAPLLTMEGHRQDATACVFAGDAQQWGVTASKDRSLRVWDLASGACVAQVQQPECEMFTGLCVSGDLVFASAFSGAVYVYRVGGDGSLGSLQPL